jgi:putative membrane protein
MLSHAEAAAIESRIAQVEGRTGVEVVTTIADRCDAYPELPWIAFAFGASFTGFAAALIDVRNPQWPTAQHGLSLVLAILGIGVICALLAHFVPSFGRAFLRPHRAQTEARQFAQAHFLDREIFATPRRTGLLILVGLYERRVVLLPDTGLRTAITTEDWDGVIVRMTPALRAGNPADALREGLDATEELLLRKGFAAPAQHANVLPDRPGEVAGP